MTRWARASPRARLAAVAAARGMTVEPPPDADQPPA